MPVIVVGAKDNSECRKVLSFPASLRACVCVCVCIHTRMHYAAAAAADSENVQVCRKDSLLQLYGDHEVILSRSLSLTPQPSCFRSLSWVTIVHSLARPRRPSLPPLASSRYLCLLVLVAAAPQVSDILNPHFYEGIHTHTSMRGYMHACIHTYIHTYTHFYERIHTHTSMGIPTLL